MALDHQSNRVLTERRDDVLVITINNPPINAGSIEVRSGILTAVQQLQFDDKLKAAVIIGGGSTFIAGSDLREFGAPLEEPQLPVVISAIENCGKPVVAAIHGAALGGGFELSLGCDARIAMDSAVVGLPEVTLGMLPGAGGTQRLPRLVGRIVALNQICSGERIKASQAKALGILDEVVEDDLLRHAVEFARKFGIKRPLAQLTVPVDDDAAFEDAAAAALKKGRGRPFVVAAIQAVRSTKSVTIEEGLKAEREAFQHFRVGPDAKALRHLFFAERQAMKIPEFQSLPVPAVTQVAVIGAGTMGAGIAIAALDAGYRVLLVEQDDKALGAGLLRVDQHYAKCVQGGKLTQATADARTQQLQGTTDWALLAQPDLVIEAVFEDLAVKQEVFRRLGKVAKASATLASNTSYLDLDKIAEASGRPHDVVGLHFFSPAQVMKLVEIVQGKQSSATALKTAFDVARKMRKLPILTGNAFGFIGNRIYAAYRRQCEFLLEEGAFPGEVDRALQAWGFAMGPFAVGDMSGLDIAWRMRKSKASDRDPVERYVHIPDKLCEAGRFGRKTGAGYFAYSEGSSRGVDDPSVHALIEAASAEAGVQRGPISADEIQRRAILSMVNEAALLVAEGVARNADDVDLVLTNGYGFPTWRGGPVWYARTAGAQEIESELDWLAAKSGAGFKRGDPARLM